MKTTILYGLILFFILESCNKTEKSTDELQNELNQLRKQQESEKLVNEEKMLKGNIQELMTLINNDENGNCKLDYYGNLYMGRRNIKFNFGGVFFDDTYPNKILVYCKEGGEDCFNTNGYQEIVIQTSDKERTKILFDEICKTIGKEIIYKEKYDKNEVRLPGN